MLIVLKTFDPFFIKEIKNVPSSERFLACVPISKHLLPFPRCLGWLRKSHQIQVHHWQPEVVLSELFGLLIPCPKDDETLHRRCINFCVSLIS